LGLKSNIVAPPKRAFARGAKKEKNRKGGAGVWGLALLRTGGKTRGGNGASDKEKGKDVQANAAIGCALEMKRKKKGKIHLSNGGGKGRQPERELH